jgi:Flp pilus assembly protein TadG
MISDRGFLARLAKPRTGFDRRGATALEFAILSIPFMLFLLFLFELGFDFYIQLAMDYAVSESARRLQTGAGNNASSVAAFKTDCLCPAIAAFLNCNQISINLYPITTADYYLNAKAGAGSIPLSGGVLSTSGYGFSTSSASTPMFLQAIYTSVSVVGLLLPVMSVSNGTTRVRVTSSTIGFINEPFSTSTSVCGS